MSFRICASIGVVICWGCMSPPARRTAAAPAFSTYGFAAWVTDSAAYFTFPMASRSLWPIRKPQGQYDFGPSYLWMARWYPAGRGVACSVLPDTTRTVEEEVTLPELVSRCEFAITIDARRIVGVGFKPTRDIAVIVDDSVVVLRLKPGSELDSLKRHRPTEAWLEIDERGMDTAVQQVTITYGPNFRFKHLP